MKKIIPILLISVLLAHPAWAASPKAGDTAPDFSLSAITGGKHTLSDLKGKVVLVGMFHICVPCMNQAMEFEKVREALSTDKLVILGINTSGDSKKAVQDYLAGFPKPVHFPYLLDPGQSVHKAYTQRDMPTVLIIDSKGVLRARTPSVGADQLVPYIKKLL
jgi:cytochrome c biogenesis protein CcmG, thiol:disulfide interchange protein DsbE